MPPKEKLWEIEPHTEVKHEILKKYLGAWLPILGSCHKRVIYIDGFAGPGKYSGGEMGSPLIVLNAITNHKIKLTPEFKLLFIEKEKERCNHLKGLINSYELPKNPKIDVNVKEGEFNETLEPILNSVSENNANLAPTFLFIDPFGFSNFPMETIKKFMANPKCEVLITFMLRDVHRFNSLDGNYDTINSLFGCKSWKKICENTDNSDEIRNKLHDLYLNQLKELARIKYVKSFKMVNKFNQMCYYLFFGTNNLLGLEKMKDAMWKVDESGKFEFSDATYNPCQTTLFSLNPNLNQLEKQLIEKFKGKRVSIQEIGDFVVGETAFRRHVHLNSVFKKMEGKNEIKVHEINGKRRKETFPVGKVDITFL